MVVGSFRFKATNGKVKTGFVTVRKYVFLVPWDCVYAYISTHSTEVNLNYLLNPRSNKKSIENFKDDFNCYIKNLLPHDMK